MNDFDSKESISTKEKKNTIYNYPEILVIICKTKSKYKTKRKVVYLVNKYKNHATYKDSDYGYIISVNLNDFKTQKFKRISENTGVLKSIYI